MKVLLTLLVALFIAIAIVTEGLVAALAELLAFVVVISWVLKSKQAVKRKEAQIEPHV
ncbi:hypothetical protein [Vibrio aphrogenes]|uniref:hypothetical protein n=1 Tax=Vibrio aphrogenes TaxID=1891186 RepID=UPI0013DE87CC|nr:hypothetical protein [Vibrio aphrogenes]